MKRDEQKRRTHSKVLDAARALFATHGYQDTTMRMIAQEAQIAVGSIFTTFESKEDVLFEIAAERYDALAAELDAVVDGTGDVRTRLKRGFAVAYAFEHPRLGLLMNQLGASWTWSRAFEAKSQARLARPFSFIARLVQEGVKNGEIRDDLDPAILADIALGLYLRNYRHAWFRELSVEDMSALSANQLDILFTGAASTR
jgi:AcrR family transcriptional regulator